ncbi:MAG: radical SAM protein [Ruminococcus sp.]|nr:radical SAM protein [Ruminococcus sp.]
MSFNECTLCPRRCETDRTQFMGYCGCDDTLKIARASLHMWEEPCISGSNGSGTIFFSGCPLKCCYCQNYEISIENFGRSISTVRLAEIMLELQSKGAHNINLVTGTPYIPFIIDAIDMIKPRLRIPIVYNSGGYESVETIDMLDGYVDIYLPDMKYMSKELALKYSKAEDYPEIAKTAIQRMYKQVGRIKYDENGIMKKGVMIRHLVLPTHKDDSIAILDWIAETFGTDRIAISLMSQYVPSYKATAHKEINRRVSTYEYNEVLKHAMSLALDGYMQDKSSATELYTPNFNLEGVLK